MEPDMIDLVVAILEEGIEKILDSASPFSSTSTSLTLASHSLEARRPGPSASPGEASSPSGMTTSSPARLFPILIRVPQQLERFGRNDEASRLWEELTDANSRSYAVWYGRADFETCVPCFSSA